MKTPSDITFSHELEAIYHAEARRVYATLVRLLGDMDLAEDALQEAFKLASQQWQNDGIPNNPRAWLVSTGRFKAIDFLRREKRLHAIREELLPQIEETGEITHDDPIEDDRLRLMFTCCHPAIAPQVQVALTLREVCGLTTEAIASAFLVSTSTMAQRIVRGKTKIKTAGIPYEVPPKSDIDERLDSVLAVIYLVFNEGYHASQGHALTRPDLSQEGIRLGRLLLELQPVPAVKGLLALMLFNESRRKARSSTNGDIILLQDQDRSLWDGALIEEARTLLQDSLSSNELSSYALEAAIAAVHADAEHFEDTDWDQLVALYNLLAQVTPSPIVELNRAIALAMTGDAGMREALMHVDKLLQGKLKNYHLAHAARADICRRLGDAHDALTAYQTALQLTDQAPEQRFLRLRIAELSK